MCATLTPSTKLVLVFLSFAVSSSSANGLSWLLTLADNSSSVRQALLPSSTQTHPALSPASSHVSPESPLVYRAARCSSSRGKDSDDVRV